jgi:hypothetical protein
LDEKSEGEEMVSVGGVGFQLVRGVENVT